MAEAEKNGRHGDMIRQFGFEPLPLEGAYLVHPFVFDDERGEFIKEYNA